MKGPAEAVGWPADHGSAVADQQHPRGQRTHEPPRGPLLGRLGRGSGGGDTLRVATLKNGPIREMNPLSLAVSYAFDAAPEGPPYRVVVKFTGRLLDGTGEPSGAASFSVSATHDKVLPGSGRVSLTHRIDDVASGRWKISAEAFAWHRNAADTGEVRRKLPQATATGATMFTRAARAVAPGVLMGAWSSMVGLGAGLALVLQAVLAVALGLQAGPIALMSTGAAVVGIAGAKIYYRLTHRTEPASWLIGAMSLQGFVIAIAVILPLAAPLVGTSPAVLLDLTLAPLLVGQAIGRLGCLAGGCCVGRPTTSRWGVWSSDRRVGTRRIPVQLMESAMAAVLALTSALLLLLAPPQVPGTLFVGGLAAYVLGRQLLFPLRAQPRATRHGRVLTLAGAAVALTVAGVLALVTS